MTPGCELGRMGDRDGRIEGGGITRGWDAATGNTAMHPSRHLTADKQEVDEWQEHQRLDHPSVM